MPRKKSGQFDQNEYIKQYLRENVKYRKMIFNVNKEEDVELLEWIDEQPEGTSNYLKRLVTKDMTSRQGKTDLEGEE